MTSAVEEVNFDFEARQEYLTGFHKRKQQRIKNAQEEAAKRARQEKLELRKQVRPNFQAKLRLSISNGTKSFYLDTRRTKARCRRARPDHKQIIAGVGSCWSS